MEYKWMNVYKKLPNHVRKPLKIHVETT